jgi:hypothetical protein
MSSTLKTGQAPFAHKPFSIKTIFGAKSIRWLRGPATPLKQVSRSVSFRSRRRAKRKHKL